MKILSAFFGVVLVCMGAYADNTQSSTNNTSGPRYSVFSTSTDWQGLTGLSLNEYHISFVSDRDLIGRKGLILYYLDGFPCYGLGFGVRTWLGPNGQTGENGGKMDIACVYAPTEINFAYRNATRDADQAQTTGLLKCPVDGGGVSLTIDLSKCTRGQDWNKMK